MNALRIAWGKRVSLGGFFLLAGIIILMGSWSLDGALRWAAGAAIFSAYVFAILWRFLPANHLWDNPALLNDLGVANDVTLLRGIFAAALGGWLFAPVPEGWLAWVPGGLYAAATLLDGLDGWLARRSGRVTRLGSILDMGLDGLGIFFATLLAVRYGQLPVWYILVGLARYLYLAGVWLRSRLDKPVYDLPPSVLRRILASSQMGFIAVILFPHFSPPVTHIAGLLFGLPFLVNFFWDWLQASGATRQRKDVWGFLPSQRSWLLVLLRAGAVLLIGYHLWVRLSRFSDLAAAAGQRGVPDAGLLLAVLIGLEALTALFLLLGAAGRLTAIGGLALLAFDQAFLLVTPVHALIAFLFTAIIYFGTGPLSLWQPEEGAFRRSIGQVS